mmetsp:Transcript_35694/g.89649  ORF Transcript_35694/g.89649 Transcript_35694/m.89649 type:complete len:123 (-) Transcript_35694:160-528(-)|eukprot:CAMPEP_0177650704 /NCGR_PEP_ID=MMETSP0447-20121125/12095_1 /TAXON_ID=0 /ORGANISM="Stygamoeba regulata, Strain BSH-02190019" /LENGTH=122 /DNA_ID=CAMNT_0019153613 /DNA_START=136 /DNA_END=504 /DNA_ORIENTATION=+
MARGIKATAPAPERAKKGGGSLKNPKWSKSKAGKRKSRKQIFAQEKFHEYPPSVPTYVNIEAPPSLLPRKKYCDISGFEAKYCDPKTKLFFYNAEVYRFIASLGTDHVQQFLALRRADVRLK